MHPKFADGSGKWVCFKERGERLWQGTEPEHRIVRRVEQCIDAFEAFLQTVDCREGIRSERSALDELTDGSTGSEGNSVRNARRGDHARCR